MPEENATEQTTSDATDKNTGSAKHESAQEPSGTQAGTTEDKPKTFTQADVDRLMAKAKREFKDDADKQKKQAELTETERLKSEKAELELKLRSREAGDTIAEAATKAGSPNPRAVVRLAQSIGLEFDKDGKLSNLKDLIAEAKDIAPELFPARTGTANGSDANNGAGKSVGQNMNDLIRQMAGR